MARSLIRSALILTLLAACSPDGGRGGGDAGPARGTDSGGMDAGVPPGVDAGPPRPRIDAGPPIDPFDPESACGSSIIPTERVPGSLLLVFDQSASMRDGPGGSEDPPAGGSKWELARTAINGVIDGVGDDLSMGLLMFPTPDMGDECNVRGAPQVPVEPLGVTRPMIQSALMRTPNGGHTPIFSALHAGWAHLDTIDRPGQRGVVLVTDGAENCDLDESDRVEMEAMTQHDTKGYLTFVVGLDQSDAVLSTLAYNGGTPRTPDCEPACEAPLCFTAADCPAGRPCNAIMIPGIPFPIPGSCGCNTDADCPSMQTCEMPFLLPKQCEGPANCCHYNAAADSFRSDFEDALGEIAERFLDSCVFEVPRGDSFDPDLVNVGVTFEGEDRTVLRRSDDETMDSWDYTDDSHDTIIIQGPICDRLLMGSADVEIVLGCPTILI